MKTTEAQRRASSKYYYKKKKELEDLLNENKKLMPDNTSSGDVSVGDHKNIDINNLDPDKNNGAEIATNEHQDIYQFDELNNNNKTYIIDHNNHNNIANGDEQTITINVDDNQLKSVLSIFVLVYVYFRIYNFSDSNTIVQQLEQKDEYLRIIDRITNKLKLIIEKYSYLQKIYNNIEDFFFIVDIVLLASVVEGEIATTTKKDKTVKEVIESEPESESEQPTNLFERL